MNLNFTRADIARLKKQYEGYFPVYDPQLKLKSKMVDDLLALHDATQWRDISTAPKDGTPVDLYGSRNGVQLRFANAKWSENVWGGQRMGTFSWSFPSWDRYGEFEFTHWQPLPDPPKAAE